MSEVSEQFDVVIIGAGMTGLSAAWHLRQLSLKVAVVSDPARPPTSGRGAGMVTAGQMDNFTRVVVAHGEEFAGELWRSGTKAFEALEAFALKRRLPWKKGRRLRLVVTPEEKTEVLEAIDRLNAARFEAKFLPKPMELGSRVLGIQDEGESAWTESTAILKALGQEAEGVTWRSAAVQRIERQASRLVLHTSKGAMMQTEMVILANHLDARALLPELKDVLVPYADQWLLIECEHALPTAWQEVGRVFSAFHGYEWGVIRGPRSLGMGGGRFLRPLAGIGAESAKVEEKATQYLLRQCEAIWPGRGQCTVKEAVALLECIPCDELPVIGPFFGDSRLLVAGGYMGSGLAMGFWAGKCLADFVQNGRCAALPPRLLPARLRSLN